MQSIFIKNNLTLFSLNDQLQKIDLIYITKSNKITNRIIFYYGLFKLIKLKLRNELDKNEKFIYKYKSVVDSECPNKIIGYDIYLFPKKWSEDEIKEKQKNIPYEERGDMNKFEKKHSKKCNDNEICKIKHTNLYNEDLFEQYENNKDFEKYRRLMALNLDKMIKISELEIVKQLLIENNKKDNLSTFQAKVIVPLNKEIMDYIKGQ
jgi:hypothetical protein